MFESVCSDLVASSWREGREPHSRYVTGRDIYQSGELHGSSAEEEDAHKCIFPKLSLSTTCCLTDLQWTLIPYQPWFLSAWVNLSSDVAPARHRGKWVACRLCYISWCWKWGGGQLWQTLDKQHCRRNCFAYSPVTTTGSSGDLRILMGQMLMLYLPLPSLQVAIHQTSCERSVMKMWDLLMCSMLWKKSCRVTWFG